MCQVAEELCMIRQRVHSFQAMGASTIRDLNSRMRIANVELTKNRDHGHALLRLAKNERLSPVPTIVLSGQLVLFRNFILLDQLLHLYQFSFSCNRIIRRTGNCTIIHCIVKCHAWSSSLKNCTCPNGKWQAATKRQAIEESNTIVPLLYMRGDSRKHPHLARIW